MSIVSISKLGHIYPIDILSISSLGYLLSTTEEDTNILTELFESIYNKLLNSEYVIDSDNLIVGIEEIDRASLTSSFFPRLELFVVKDATSRYTTERYLNFNIHLCIVGTLETDIQDCIAFGVNTRALLYSMNTDKYDGNTPCKGFIGAKPTADLEVDKELYKEDTYSFILNFVFEIRYRDTRFQ